MAMFLYIRLKYSSAQPVYGFNGAISALGQGELLHYDINLPACHLTHPTADLPAFMDRFGGFVNYYRTINEQKPVPRTNIVFYQQKIKYKGLILWKQ